MKRGCHQPRRAPWPGDAPGLRPPVHGHARRAGRHEDRTIAWTYAFTPDALPPNALDEHVLIGGRYFDLVDTACHRVPEDGVARLEIVVD